MCAVNKVKYQEIIETISNSHEFESYLIAHFIFTGEINSAQEGQIIGQIDGKEIYRTDIDIRLFENVMNARSEFINKYPEYCQLDDYEKARAIENAYIKSDVLNNYIYIEFDQNIHPRLKNNTENDQNNDTIKIHSQVDRDRFKFEEYSNVEDAYEACKKYSQKDSVESGGFIFPDGRALFVTDKLATIKDIDLPVWNMGANGTYHYHPSGNPNMSDADSLSMDSIFKKHTIYQMIIITKDSVSTYNFK